MSRVTTANSTAKRGPTSAATVAPPPANASSKSGAASKLKQQQQQQPAAAAASLSVEFEETDHDEAQDFLFERAADYLFSSEYLLVLIGPSFDDGGTARNPFASEQSHFKMAQYPKKFFGFWGSYYNDALDRRPHSGYHILSRWRDGIFAQGTGPGGSKSVKAVAPSPADDDGKGLGKGEGGKSNFQLLQQRMFMMTSLTSNMPSKAGLPSDEVYEVCGNVTQWQCGQNNRCGPPFTFLLDKALTFDVDECTHEALPLKYVPPTDDHNDNSHKNNNNNDDDNNFYDSKLRPASAKNRGVGQDETNANQDPFALADRLAMSDNEAEEDDYDRLVRNAKLFERNPDFYSSEKGGGVAAAAANRSAMSRGGDAVFQPMNANSAFNNFESRVGRDDRGKRDMRREARARVIRVKKEWQFGMNSTTIASSLPSLNFAGKSAPVAVDPNAIPDDFIEDPFAGFVTDIELPIKQMPVPQSRTFDNDDQARTQAQLEMEVSQMVNSMMPQHEVEKNNNNIEQQQQQNGEGGENSGGDNNNNNNNEGTENEDGVDENDTAAQSFNPLLARPTSATKPISVHKLGKQYCKKTISHLYAHSQVIDRGIHFSERVGQFQLVDSKRYFVEREALYAAFSGQKSYTFENSNAFARRANTIRYNISMIFMSNDDGNNNNNTNFDNNNNENSPLTFAENNYNNNNNNNTSNNKLTSNMPSIVFRPSPEEHRILGDFNSRVLPTQEMAESLFRPPSSKSSERASIVQFLNDKSKIQGKNGWYFFSHIPPAKTCQEPIRGLLYDQVRVNFPEYRKTDFDQQSQQNLRSNILNQFNSSTTGGNASFNRSATSTTIGGANLNSAEPHAVPLVRRIPPNGGKVSIVVDMLQIFNLGVSPSTIPTYEYSSRVFHVVGYLPPPLVAAQEFIGSGAYFAGANERSAGGMAGRSYGGTSSSSSAAAAANAPRYLEYLLETAGNCPFVVKIGVLAHAPSIIQYVECDVPCGRAESQYITSLFSRGGATTNTTTSSSSSGALTTSASKTLGSQSFASKAANTLGGAAALLKPVPNHIFCPHCRGLARPHITMVPFSAPPGTKDPLFCYTAQYSKTRLFQGWLKLILDSIKQDQSKSLCILELGAEKKNDATKSLGEKTYKVMATTANGRLRYIRMSSQKIDSSKLVKSKPGGGGASGSSNNNNNGNGNAANTGKAGAAGKSRAGQGSGGGSGGDGEEGDTFVCIQGNPSMGLSRLDSMLYDRMRKR